MLDSKALCQKLRTVLQIYVVHFDAKNKINLNKKKFKKLKKAKITVHNRDFGRSNILINNPNFGRSKITVHNRNFGWSKIRFHSRTFGRFRITADNCYFEQANRTLVQIYGCMLSI